jgi:hypothetical protein
MLIGLVWPGVDRGCEMIYMLPIGGNVPPDFGVLTTPGHKGIPAGVIAGRQWAGDNQAFTQKFELSRFSDWLVTMIPYRRTCLFISVPDVVGNATKTIDLFNKYASVFSGWTLAFVAQDGQEKLDFPNPILWTTLFIGGSTVWKDGPGAAACIDRAMKLNKRIHIGRINEWKRYDKFSQFEKGYQHEFTCDGTKNRFIGVEKTIRILRSFRERSRRQDGLPVFISDCPG